MIIFGAELAGRRLRRPGVIRWCDRVCGAVLIGFGVKLALQPRLA
ncbi:LysE family transporter [Microlunatus parietis]|uniref:Threonine/homoserine/homoserine lactone efflux protein n=1 Tax=Microlunatus parietis TaxID=682979 RepID=A0A7Y9IAW3_9ACTN|nr:LysE family transporter [Microlunatus parietis]NYE73533.1 threonine/homoserine/homoserine lactone efflux protein [Microlunatus parietis]